MSPPNIFLNCELISPTNSNEPFRWVKTGTGQQFAKYFYCMVSFPLLTMGGRVVENKVAWNLSLFFSSLLNSPTLKIGITSQTFKKPFSLRSSSGWLTQVTHESVYLVFWMQWWYHYLVEVVCLGGSTIFPGCSHYPFLFSSQSAWNSLSVCYFPSQLFNANEFRNTTYRIIIISVAF